MLGPIFELAARSPNRQDGFRRLLRIHLLCLAGSTLLGVWAAKGRMEHVTAGPQLVLFHWIGWTLLIAGIVEGALVLGWRLTQWPKSRALELLLLSPVASWRVMLGEQLVGVTHLAFLSLSSVPILSLLVALRWLAVEQALLAVLLGLASGCITGLGLVWWAYEPRQIRRRGERFALVCLVVYLLFFGLLGERTYRFLVNIPDGWGNLVLTPVLWSLRNNPFDLVFRVGQSRQDDLLPLAVGMLAVGAAVILALLVRAALRLKGHYLDQNYRPLEGNGRRRGTVGDFPLSWWAVRRVNEYPGRINLYLAAGATLFYATYLLVGKENWPAVLGQRVFVVYELLGGIASFTAVLACLAAVPAAYQYGLWDSSIPDRCKRLEVLLPTELTAIDYLRASIAASWQRGRGYFLTALALWITGYVAARYDAARLLAGVAGGAALVALYFAVGFRYFARSKGNASLGFFLTMLLPLATWTLGANGGGALARWLPPGIVYYATATDEPFRPIQTVAAIFLMLAAACLLIRQAGVHFDREIRQWYDEHQGKSA